MSTCSAILVAAVALFMQHLYRGILPGTVRGPLHRRWTSHEFVVSAAGLAFASAGSGVVKGLEIIIAITPIMGITFWMGILLEAHVRRGGLGRDGGGLCHMGLLRIVLGLSGSHEHLARVWEVSAAGAAVATRLGDPSHLPHHDRHGGGRQSRHGPVEAGNWDRFYRPRRRPSRPGGVILHPARCRTDPSCRSPGSGWSGRPANPRPGRRSMVGLLSLLRDCRDPGHRIRRILARSRSGRMPTLPRDGSVPGPGTDRPRGGSSARPPAW